MMTKEELEKLNRENPSIAMIRYDWDFSQYHRDYWRDLGVTVLICQRKTPDITKLCLESLLRFYPDIPVIVVDGDSQDESTLYLKYKAIVSPNVKFVHHFGPNSHGTTMHEIVMEHVNTEYVLLMDSDLISMRYGYIEGMLQQLISEKLYATGSLMLTTRKNYSCGPIEDVNDVLRYAHPSCSLYHVPTYKSMNAPFANHGAPCVYNMMAAEKMGLKIGYWPLDKYTAHLSGASWCVPRTIWIHDHDVPQRPFITFIVTNEKQVMELSGQNDHDFDVIPLGNPVSTQVVCHDDCVPMNVNNRLYDIRFRVHGDYVCLLDPAVERIDNVIVTMIKQHVIEQNAPDELNVGGLRVVKRKVWQRKDCML
jgi:hypothetical protein